ncbi:HAD family hydrolase [Hydrogenimonas sp.]
MKTTILFDLDGTLIDSTEAILESFCVAFATFGSQAPDAGRIEAMIGHPLDTMFENLGVEPGLVMAHVDAYKEHYRQISRQKTVLLPGAGEAVEAAAEFARLGIVTTKTGRYSRELLEHLGLMHRFDVLIGREDVVSPKPHPEPIYRALERMGRGADTCWMVGDTLLDIDAAKAAGATPFAVMCGYGTRAELEAACEHTAEDAAGAVSTIRSLV